MISMLLEQVKLLLRILSQVNDIIRFRQTVFSFSLESPGDWLAAITSVGVFVLCLQVLSSAQQLLGVMCYWYVSSLCLLREWLHVL